MAEATNIEAPINDAHTVLEALKEDLGPDGFHRDLDAAHSAIYLSRGPNLLVSLEKIQDTLSGNEDGVPLSLDFAEDKNWSVLHITADGDTWFRSPALYAFFDELVDDGFFETFDQVAFYGAGMGGYAATAFCVAAPGARVIALAPQATMDIERTEWDDRFPRSRRLGFTDRYTYGPDMVEAAQQAFVLYDPHELHDSIHASLFSAPHVHRLKCRFLGADLARALRDMDLLHRVVEDAANGRLTPQGFYAMLRKRRDYKTFLRNLLFHLDDKHRPYLTALYCSHVLSRMNAPAFRRRLNAARASLSESGPLPEWLAED